MNTNALIIGGVCILFVGLAGMVLVQESRNSKAPEPVAVLTNETLGHESPDLSDRPQQVQQKDLGQELLNLYDPTPDSLYNPKHSTNLLQRVEALTHGISVGLPAEFDEYGLEIRKLMEDVGGDDYLKGTQYMQDRLPLIQKAQALSEEWFSDIQDEIEELETLIEKTQPDTKVTSLFRFNRANVNTFLSELETWLNKNEEFYEFMIAADGGYRFDSVNRPIFEERLLTGRFYRIYRQRNEAAKRMQDYAPFRETKI